MRRFAFAAIAAMLLIGPSDSREWSYSHSSYSCRRCADGSSVHGPTWIARAAYGHVSADCADGVHSYSHYSRGTCSRHETVTG